MYEYIYIYIHIYYVSITNNIFWEINILFTDLSIHQ